jgi:hypothetical protein
MNDPIKTGWPPGMLQDDSQGLSRWLASKPDARRRVREVCQDIKDGVYQSQLQRRLIEMAERMRQEADLESTE